jgi:hypothetical protein
MLIIKGILMVVNDEENQKKKPVVLKIKNQWFLKKQK